MEIEILEMTRQLSNFRNCHESSIPLAQLGFRELLAFNRYITPKQKLLRRFLTVILSNICHLQVSEDSMKILSQWYTFELRGSIFVKGKDNMTTYLVVGRKWSTNYLSIFVLRVLSSTFFSSNATSSIVPLRISSTLTCENGVGFNPVRIEQLFSNLILCPPKKMFENAIENVLQTKIKKSHREEKTVLKNLVFS